jgi:hypothetical protein
MERSLTVESWGVLRRQSVKKTVLDLMYGERSEADAGKLQRLMPFNQSQAVTDLLVHQVDALEAFDDACSSCQARDALLRSTALHACSTVPRWQDM